MELMTEEKKGFKRTEVGAIPEDWDVLNIGDILKLKSGYAFSSEYYSDYGPILLTPGNFKLTGGLYFNDRNTKRFSGEYSRNQVFSKGDLLVVMTDLTPDCNLLGKPAVVDVDEPVLHNQRIGKIELFKPNISEDFLYYYFLSSTYLDHIKNTSTGSTVSHTSNGSIYASKIPLPPTLEEQQAIASALSDVDELIRSLDGLIQKKQSIKKGAMQQLLNGKKRLPGFDGEWEVKNLGDIIIRADLGGNYSNSEKSSKYPLIKMGNLGRGEINLDKKYYIDEEERVYSADKLEYGDLLFNTRNTPQLVGKVAIWRDEMNEAYYNSNLMKLEFDDEFVSSNFFMNYLLNTDRFIEKLRSIATGTTSVAAIYTRDLYSLELSLPKGKEQKAIAQTLSDMDRELQTLRQKREKYVQIKQGMMQELLTGKTRLI